MCKISIYRWVSINQASLAQARTMQGMDGGTFRAISGRKNLEWSFFSFLYASTQDRNVPAAVCAGQIFFSCSSPQAQTAALDSHSRRVIMTLPGHWAWGDRSQAGRKYVPAVPALDGHCCLLPAGGCLGKHYLSQCTYLQRLTAERACVCRRKRSGKSDERRRKKAEKTKKTDLFLIYFNFPTN